MSPALAGGSLPRVPHGRPRVMTGVIKVKKSGWKMWEHKQGQTMQDEKDSAAGFEAGGRRPPRGSL